MKQEFVYKYIAGLMAVNIIAASLASCSAASSASSASSVSSASFASSTEAAANTTASVSTLDKTDDTKATVTALSTADGGKLSADELFTERDLTQTADLSEASNYTVSDGKTITITKAGVYHISGTASDATIVVEAGSDDKVQIVLDGVSITNTDFPCLYVKQADKVFVTLVGENTLSVTGSFTTDGDTNTDGVIFSKDDLVLNGTGSLTVNSTDNGIVCKDDLKVTGGSYTVTASSKALEANDSIRIADGTFTLKAGTDGLHAENDDDDTLGYIYIGGGSFTIQAGDDGIHANSLVQIDGGSFTVSAAECIEGTYIQINDGTFALSSWDDAINAAKKSSAYSTPTVEINGGDITITMSAGDTDGIDSNGDIIVNGGTINITGNSSFDYDGSAQYNGGTIIVNGEQITSIPNQMMGGGMGGRGQMGGMDNMGGFGGHGRRG